MLTEIEIVKGLDLQGHLTLKYNVQIGTIFSNIAISGAQYKIKEALTIWPFKYLFKIERCYGAPLGEADLEFLKTGNKIKIQHQPIPNNKPGYDL